MKRFCKVYIPQSISELEKQGFYIWRHKHIGFNQLPQPVTPPRENKDILDDFDFVFLSKKDFNEWFDETSVGLAELDQVLNYCKYFIREKGNQGRYEREGKSIKVDGTWDGYHINTPMMKDFKEFLLENGWLENWFELHPRYFK